MKEALRESVPSLLFDIPLAYSLSHYSSLLLLGHFLLTPFYVPFLLSPTSL